MPTLALNQASCTKPLIRSSSRTTIIAVWLTCSNIDSISRSKQPSKLYWSCRRLSTGDTKWAYRYVPLFQILTLSRLFKIMLQIFHKDLLLTKWSMINRRIQLSKTREKYKYAKKMKINGSSWKMWSSPLKSRRETTRCIRRRLCKIERIMS